MSAHAPSAAEAKSQLEQTYGVLLIGTLLSSVLYGLTSHQTYRYYRRFPKDRWSLKSLVIILWSSDTLYTAASFHWCYYYLITHFGNPGPLQFVSWSIRMGVVLSFVIGIASNVFYVTRMHMMGLNKFVSAGIVVTTILPRCAFEFAIFAKLLQDFSFAAVPGFRWMIEVVFALAAVSSTLLALGLGYVLRRKRTGYSSTDSKIDVLIVYTVNTGLLSSVLCFAGLFSTIFMPKSFLYLGVLSMLTKVYVNSVMAVLNSRRSMNKIDESMWELGAFDSSWKHKPERQHHLTFTHGSFALRGENGQTGTFQATPIQINVSETKTMQIDDQDGSLKNSV